MSNIDKISLDAAHKIEDIFWQEHRGGASQMLSRIQIIIRDAIAIALSLKDKP